MTRDINFLCGKWFYDSYNGTEGRIGPYLGAGFYLEYFDEQKSPSQGQRIFNLANLMRSGRFFETKEQRDQWIAEKEQMRNPDFEIKMETKKQ